MVATNDFKPFATGVGANVITQADYVASAFVTGGFNAGIAQSNQLNKVWRQSAFMASVLAQYMANTTGDDILDDGDEAGKVAILANAIQLAGAIRPAVLEPLSFGIGSPRLILASEFAVGFDRAAGPAATWAQFAAPGVLQQGQEWVVEDVLGNANAFPITVLPPAGATFSGAPNFVLNVNRQSQKFRFYSGTTWSLST